MNVAPDPSVVPDINKVVEEEDVNSRTWTVVLNQRNKSNNLEKYSDFNIGDNK